MKKKQGETSNSPKKMNRSMERPMLMLEKGQMYKKKIDEMRAKKEEEEVVGCTFAPKVNAAKNNMMDKRKSVDPSHNYNNVF